MGELGQGKSYLFFYYIYSVEEKENSKSLD